MKTRKNRKATKRIFTRKDYNAGDGMLTTVWGPPMWHYLHTMSFNYPVNPNSSKCFGIALKKAGYISRRANTGTRYAVRELTGMEVAEREESNQAPPPHVPSPEELLARPELALGV